MQSVVSAFVLVCVAGVRAQHVACQEDAQCPVGAYCLEDLAFCTACIQCEDLNREKPYVPTSCIRSVVECGPCYKGLMIDRSGDVRASCVPSDSQSTASMPAYAWVLICIFSIVVIAVFVYAAYYGLRNVDHWKISSHTSVQTPGANGVVATAPHLPPPYNDDYAPVSAFSSPPFSSSTDPLQPLVKRVPESRPLDSRDLEANQAAHVYDPPIFDRHRYRPPRYDEAANEDSDNAVPFTYHDEDTMESTWSPNNTSDNVNNDAAAVSAPAAAEPAAGGSAPTRAAAVRRGDHTDAPPPKVVCVREDSNNNRSRPPAGETSAPSPSAAGVTSVVINVLNVNSVKQINDESL